MGTLNSHPNYTARNVQMNGGNREPIIWGLILGLLAQAIYEASRILVGQYVRLPSTYWNILLAVSIPIAVLYLILLRGRRRGP